MADSQNPTQLLSYLTQRDDGKKIGQTRIRQFICSEKDRDINFLCGETQTVKFIAN